MDHPHGAALGPCLPGLQVHGSGPRDGVAGPAIQLRQRSEAGLAASRPLQGTTGPNAAVRHRPGWTAGPGVGGGGGGGVGGGGVGGSGEGSATRQSRRRSRHPPRRPSRAVGQGACHIPAAKSRMTAAAPGPASGRPWPPARTDGSRSAIDRMEARVASRSHVVYQGGAERPWLPHRRPADGVHPEGQERVAADDDPVPGPDDRRRVPGCDPACGSSASRRCPGSSRPVRAGATIPARLPASRIASRRRRPMARIRGRISQRSIGPAVPDHRAEVAGGDRDLGGVDEDRAAPCPRPAPGPSPRDRDGSGSAGSRPGGAVSLRPGIGRPARCVDHPSPSRHR